MRGLQELAKLKRQKNVRVEMKSPAVGREVLQASLDQPSFGKSIALAMMIFAEQCVNRMSAAQFPRRAITFAGDNDPPVQQPNVAGDRFSEEVGVAYANGNSFDVHGGFHCQNKRTDRTSVRPRSMVLLAKRRLDSIGCDPDGIDSRQAHAGRVGNPGIGLPGTQLVRVMVLPPSTLSNSSIDAAGAATTAGLNGPLEGTALSVTCTAGSVYVVPADVTVTITFQSRGIPPMVALVPEMVPRLAAVLGASVLA
jgi:hypothetical protein